MSYEWKFNPRPYSDEEAKKLLAPVVDAETTDWHYNTHHKGYVKALNTIEKGLESADRGAANGNYSEVGELKRRMTWNHAGTVLHDIYWDVMGGDGDPSKGPEVKAAIEDGSLSAKRFNNYLRLQRELSTLARRQAHKSRLAEKKFSKWKKTAARRNEKY